MSLFFLPAPRRALAALCFLSAAAPLSAQCGGQPEQILRASDGAPADLYGHDVAASGSRLLIGVPEDADAGRQSGSAWVQWHDGFQWLEEQKLRASDAGPGDWFGLAVDLDGTLAVVGAPGRADRGTSSGAVYVYRHNGVKWVQEQKLLASDGQAFDQFGFSVAVDQDQILVGAWGDDDAAADGGAAYVFRFNGTKWVEERKLVPGDGGPSNWFGWSVDTAPGLAVIGCPFDDDQGSAAGAVYVYRHDGVRWRRESKLLAFDGATNQSTGISVATDGARIVAGAWMDDDRGPTSGSAYVWRDATGTWKNEGKLLASDGLAFDQFGTSVGIDRDLVVVGAHATDDGATDAGSAYVYRRNGGQWQEEGKLRHPKPSTNDYLGWSVTVSGDVVAAGAYLDDGKGTDAGAALVWRQAELGLEASPNSVSPGATLTFTTCRGQPRAPVLLMVVNVSAIPVVFPVASGRFDAAGNWGFGATVPPGLSLNMITFLSFGFAASGELLTSNRQVVAFQ